MRNKIAGLAAVIAATISAAPAMACYNGCSQGFNFGTNYASGCGVNYGGCGYGTSYREHLPDPTAQYSYSGPQYYYVNQGPTYTGPGDVAPAPTYQERAVSGWTSYNRRYYYGYNGGPYSDTTSHYYDGANVQGPAIYSYRWHRRHGYSRTNFRGGPRAPKYFYTTRPGVRYGYAGQRGPRSRVY